MATVIHFEQNERHLRTIAQAIIAVNGVSAKPLPKSQIALGKFDTFVADPEEVELGAVENITVRCNEKDLLELTTMFADLTNLSLMRAVYDSGSEPSVEYERASSYAFMVQLCTDALSARLASDRRITFVYTPSKKIAEKEGGK